MRPAVTFGLVAYNQEKYVREAIEGAFSQQFSSLEIVLSDDSSTDSTFQIMQEMARAYSGPHDVIVRREPVNVGTVQHLINVARAANGDLLVVAAGDDISYPDRVDALYSAWKETGAEGLASGHDEIDEKGQVIRRDVSFPPSEITQKIFGQEAQAQRIDGIIQTVPGFAAAYPRSFWADLPDPPTVLLVEDGMASAFLNLRGQRIHRVGRSLLAYRLISSSLTVRTGALTLDDLRERERKIDQRGRALIHEMDYTLGQIQREQIVLHPTTTKWFSRARNQGELIAGFWEIGPVARMLRITKIRTRYDASFVLPRLMGFKVFAALRSRLQR